MNGKRRRRSPILNNGSKTSESKKVVLAPPSLKFDHANLNISESEKQKFRSGQYEKELKDHMKKTGDISGYQGSTNVSNSKLKDTAKFVAKEAIIHRVLHGAGAIISGTVGAMLIPKSGGASNVLDKYGRPIN